MDAMRKSHEPTVASATGQQVEIIPASAMQPPAEVSETGALLSMLERAAGDPRVDIDKFERLLQMQRQVKADHAREAFAAALAAMQPNLPVITEKGRIEVREKDAQGGRTGALKQSTSYARWEDINEAIKPVLAEHGFALSFRTGVAADGKLTVTGILSHRQGHQEETTIALPHDSTGSKNAVQAVGSSTSYGKRYTASALLNITSRGEDDDGQAGGVGATITEEQAMEIRERLEACNARIPVFCQYLGVPNIAGIPASKFADAIRAVEAKEKLARAGQ